MSKPFKRVVYGRWDDCMKVVRKAKLNLKTPTKRLYDRWDIEELDGSCKALFLSQVSNQNKGRHACTMMMDNILVPRPLLDTDDIYCLTLYKD